MIEKNLNAIIRLYPGLSDYKAVTSHKKLEFITSRTGKPTVKYNGLFLHSKYDPQKEAEKISLEVEQASLYIIGGLGLGYLPREILKNRKIRVIVFEPDVDMFMELIANKDFTALFTNPDFHLILGQSSEYIKNYLNPQKIKKAVYIPLINRVKDNEIFLRVSEIIKLYNRRMEINRNTLIKFGKLWVKNQSKNLPMMGYKNDLNDIFGKFRGIPGIIIAAGPSMEDIIPYIKDIRERFVILAVDTALKSILDEGIEPDFVMSVDAQYWNAKHLEGIKTEKTILIADSSIQPAALRSFNKRVYFVKSTFPLGKYFESVRSPFPKIASGGSVSTNIFDFARKLGLSEIYLAGQDLGYPGYITHYKNSYFEKNMLITSSRTNPLETKSFTYIYDGYPVVVKSNSGNNILSDKKMNIYIDWFNEQILVNKDQNCYNLSKNGCRIEGIPYKGIEPLLLYSEQRERITKIIKCLKKDDESFYLPKLLDSAVSFRKSLKVLVEIADKAVKLTTQIESDYFNNKSVGDSLKELDKIDNIITGLSQSETLSFIIEPFIQKITEADTPSPLESLRLSGELYYKIVSIAELHIKYLNQSIESIRSSIKSL